MLIFSLLCSEKPIEAIPDNLSSAAVRRVALAGVLGDQCCLVGEQLQTLLLSSMLYNNASLRFLGCRWVTHFGHSALQRLKSGYPHASNKWKRRSSWVLRQSSSKRAFERCCGCWQLVQRSLFPLLAIGLRQPAAMVLSPQPWSRPAARSAHPPSGDHGKESSSDCRCCASARDTKN